MTVPALGRGLPGSRGAPLAGPSGVLVSADHAGVDLSIPVQLPSTVGLGTQAGLDAGPGPVGCQRANRLDTVSQGPYRSGRSRQGTPLRTRNKIPLRTWRWSRQRPPRLDLDDGSSAASRSHSSSVISTRRFTASFYLNVGPQLNSGTDPRNML